MFKDNSTLKQLAQNFQRQLNQLTQTLSQLSPSVKKTNEHLTIKLNEYSANKVALLAPLYEKEDADVLAQFYQLHKALPQPLRSNLNEVDWNQYAFDSDYSPRNMITGIQEFSIQPGLANNDGDYSQDEKLSEIPTEIPFYGADNCYFINKNDDSLEIVNALVFRLAVMAPSTSLFTLIDPNNMGQSFPYAKRLPAKRMVENDVSKVLEEILNDIVRIQNTYLDNNVERLSDVNPDILGNAKYELIVAKDFPQAYDRRSIELLAKIANTGPKAGKVLVLEHDKEAEMPNGVSLAQFRSLTHLFNAELKISVKGGKKYREYSLKKETINAILDGLERAKPKDTKLGFDDVVEMNPEAWWRESAQEFISAPIGGSGSRKNDIELWFGERNHQPSSHGMLAAMTGAGKSNLYHAFILSLASRYSPEDLQFYLIDGKQGVEFQKYPQLPHARVVSLNTSPQLARSVLEELLAEMNRRNDLFKSLGLSDFIAYRKAGSPQGKMPRLLLVVDEYQTLFEDDRAGQGSQLMFNIASQSRSAGIHMFVGSQKFIVPGMSQPQTIFSNINMRIAMKMSGEEITSLQEFGPKGKQLVRGCTETGQLVVSHNGGVDEMPCSAGRVAFIADEQREQLLKGMINKWQQQSGHQHVAILLDGEEQPTLSNNAQLHTLFEQHPTRPNEEQWIKYANQGEHQGGLGEREWYPIERPSVFWFGQEMNIYSQAKLILRRRANEHLLLVGDSNEARLGMLGYFLAQLPINATENQASAIVLDRSIKGSPWYGVMSAANQYALKGQANVIEKFSEFSLHLDTVIAEFKLRQNMPEEDMLAAPSIFILINEAQRIKELSKQDDAHGLKVHENVAAQHLTTLLENGSEYGIHLVLSFDNVRSVTKAFNRQEIDSFRHKIALQMSEEDSFRLLKTRDAAKLQASGKKPIYALHIDQMQNRPNKFKPYCYFDSAELQTELESLASHYTRWGE